MIIGTRRGDARYIRFRYELLCSPAARKELHTCIRLSLVLLEIQWEFGVRILLIGYLYGIASERKLVEELRMHLAWRWFTGL